eukprot:3735773-Prymnesium_polylepis.1
MAGGAWRHWVVRRRRDTQARVAALGERAKPARERVRLERGGHDDGAQVGPLAKQQAQPRKE